MCASMWEKMAALAAKRSAAFVRKANLGNPLRPGDKASKQRIHPGFETQGRRQQKSKMGITVAPQKGLMFSKIFLKIRFR